MAVHHNVNVCTLHYDVMQMVLGDPCEKVIWHFPKEVVVHRLRTIGLEVVSFPQSTHD